MLNLHLVIVPSRTKKNDILLRIVRLSATDICGYYLNPFTSSCTLKPYENTLFQCKEGAYSKLSGGNDMYIVT